MQSKKRFTEINVWETNWFTKLNPTQKLFWLYINQRCDNIGIWELNLKLVAFHLELEGEVDQFAYDFLQTINDDMERIIVLDTNKWFVLGFVKFQFVKDKPLNPRNPAHKSYLKQITDSGLYTWFVTNQPEVLSDEESPQRAFQEEVKRNKDKDKGKGKEVDKVKEKDVDVFMEKKKEEELDYDPFEGISGFNETVKRLVTLNPFFDEAHLIKDLERCASIVDKYIDYGWDLNSLETVLRKFIKCYSNESLENILYDFDANFRDKPVIETNRN